MAARQSIIKLSESDVEKRVCAHARKMGIYTRKFTSPGNAGVPDRIFVYDERIVFVEFKREGKTPTDLQKYEIDLLNLTHGIPATWVDNGILAMELLLMLKKGETGKMQAWINERNNWKR